MYLHVDYCHITLLVILLVQTMRNNYVFTPLFEKVSFDISRHFYRHLISFLNVVPVAASRRSISGQCTCVWPDKCIYRRTWLWRKIIASGAVNWSRTSQMMSACCSMRFSSDSSHCKNIETKWSQPKKLL